MKRKLNIDEMYQRSLPFQQHSDVITPYKPQDSHTYQQYQKRLPRPQYKWSANNNNNNNNNNNTNNNNNKKYKKISYDQTFMIRQVINIFKRFQYEKFIVEGSSILNLASGYSDENKLARRKMAYYIAVDLLGETLEECRKRTSSDEIYQKWVKETQFLQKDLRYDVIKINPKVNIVLCQLALHYLWGDLNHINNILSTVQESLQQGGFFICTIVDSLKIQNTIGHPRVKFSHIIEAKEKESKNKDPGNIGEKGEKKDEKPYVSKHYYFTFPGLVTNTKEYVIESQFLIEKCKEFSLTLVHQFSVKDVWKHLLPLFRNEPIISDEDWKIIDVYRCYIFSRT